MNYKFKFADILKYVIIGFFATIFGSIIIPGISKNILIDTNSVDNLILKLIIPVVVILGCYIIGICVQAFIGILWGDSFLGISIKEVCYLIRKHAPRFTSDDIPDWIYWSNRPDSVIKDITEQTEVKLKNDSKSEYFLFNQLFQGIFMVSLMTLLILIVSKCVYFLSIFVLLLLLRLHFFSTKPLRTMAVVIGSLILLICYGWGEDVKNVAIIGSLCGISWVMGLYFARKHIISINSFSVTDKESLDLLLRKSGIPTMYILVRTNNGKYIGKTLESIKIQDYPNIKVVVVEDRVVKDADVYSIEEIISSYDKDLDILYYKSSRTNPFALSVEVKKIFLNYANNEDFAMILDSDDYLSCTTVVSDIITQMCKKNANLCLVGFEIFGKQELNYSKNYHNKYIKEIAKLNASLGFTSKKEVSSELYHVETIGWTKCYRKCVLEKFMKIFDKYQDAFLQEYTKDRGELTKYEDFPDVLTLMFADTRITAIGYPCYRYRKETGSVTTQLTSDNYKVQIVGFLALTYYLYNSSKGLGYYAKKVDIGVIRKFVVFKFIQYFDTIRGLAERRKIKNDYNEFEFYGDFISVFKKYGFSESDILKVVREEWNAIEKKNIFDLFKSKESMGLLYSKFRVS